MRNFSNRFVNALTDWAHDVLDNDVYYGVALQIDDINDYAIKGVDIKVEKDDLKLVGYYDNTSVFEVMATVTTEIEIWHPDYDTAYWDSEDHMFYFLNENVKNSIISDLIIPVEISADLQGNIIDVGAINNGDKITEKEILNSFRVLLN